MSIAIIGCGAIGEWVAQKLDPSPQIVRRGETLPQVDLVVEVAGHQALRDYGVAALGQGSDLIIASVGALADRDLYESLRAAAGSARIYLPAGAVPGIDALSAARDGLKKVRYISRKPPASLGVEAMDEPRVIFEGNAREAALRFPQNANVAATIALAGIGFEQTLVQIIADPTVTRNVHQVQASGDFGDLSIEISGRPLPGNPKSSSLTAMSVLRCITNRSSAIVI